MRPQILQLVDPSADTAPRQAASVAEALTELPVSDVRPKRPPGSMPDLGDLIADTYEVVGELGGGGMGVVLAAIDRQLQRMVAIKLIHEELRSHDFRARFTLEARAMALVSHPNVVTIHAFGEHEGAPFMVMELVDGSTLETWMSAQPGGADVDEALRILNQICLGVSAIHAAGTLHRDLKPSNILLDAQLRARVSDLGLAVPFKVGVGNKEPVGTPGYIAPEIHFDISADGGATPQSDVYSLACIAFELLTGRPPYEANDDLALAVLHGTATLPVASDIRRTLPRALDEVLQHALAKDPRERTASVELFRRALLEARNDSLEPVRILVAEDDPDFRELLQLALSEEFPGADVECVPDGKRAIQAFDQKPASVVVLDLQMPEMDGMAATALLRARPAAHQVPIIVVSASGGPKEWKLLASLGADRFLVKPVSLDDLISTIRRATRERSSGSATPANGFKNRLI
jgi:eukaryotic-like serine/threonine-protein kinase